MQPVQPGQSVPWTAHFPDFPSSSRVPEPDPRASSRHPVDCSETCRNYIWSWPRGRERHKDKVLTLKVTLLYNDLEPNGLSHNGLRQFFLVQSLLAKDARLVSDKLLFLPAPCRSASRCSLIGGPALIRHARLIQGGDRTLARVPTRLVKASWPGSPHTGHSPQPSREVQPKQPVCHLSARASIVARVRIVRSESSVSLGWILHGPGEQLLHAAFLGIGGIPDNSLGLRSPRLLWVVEYGQASSLSSLRSRCVHLFEVRQVLFLVDLEVWEFFDLRCCQRQIVLLRDYVR